MNRFAPDQMFASVDADVLSFTEPSSPRRGAGPGAPIGRVPRIEGRRVLVVDDCPEVRSVLSRILWRASYWVRTAADADEARALLEDGEHFDLAIVDLDMPRLAAIEVAEHLGLDTAVLFTTAIARLADLTMLSPNHSLLAGTFTTEEFLTRVDTLLEPRALPVPPMRRASGDV